MQLFSSFYEVVKPQLRGGLLNDLYRQSHKM